MQVSDFEAGCSAATAFKQLALLQETGTHPHASYDDREMHGLVPGPQVRSIAKASAAGNE